MRPGAGEEDAFQAVMEKRLSQGRKVLRRLRWTVGGGMGLLGCLSALLYMALKDWQCIVDDGNWTAKNCYLALAYWLRYVFFGLAPLADDTGLTRLVVALDALLLLVDQAQDWLVCPLEEASLFNNLLYTGQTAFVLCCMLFLTCDTAQALAMQARLWRAFCAMASIQVVLLLADLAHDVLQGRGGAPYFDVWLPSSLLAALFFARREPRDWCHGILAGTLERRSSGAAAAGVAGLVGDCAPRDVALQAAARFRGVEMGRLPFHAVSGNAPDSGCYLLSRPLASGQRCDAFVSHSWHDDAQAKWLALQAWRRDFVERRGREPVVWLDRCCIDQTNIDADLRCLPIFLSRCDEMLTLCGVTYLSRLWCVVEVFTYVHVSGRLEGLKARPVLRRGFEEHDRKEVEAQAAGFDAGLCDCFDARDKARMLAIIRTAFGSLQRFNAAVAGIFRRLARDDEAIAEEAGRSSSSAAESEESSDVGGSEEGGDAHRRPVQPSWTRCLGGLCPV